jgi:hypothetical protein
VTFLSSCSGRHARTNPVLEVASQIGTGDLTKRDRAHPQELVQNADLRGLPRAAYTATPQRRNELLKVRGIQGVRIQ